LAPFAWNEQTRSSQLPLDYPPFHYSVRKFVPVLCFQNVRSFDCAEHSMTSSLLVGHLLFAGVFGAPTVPADSGQPTVLVWLTSQTRQSFFVMLQ